MRRMPDNEIDYFSNFGTDAPIQPRPKKKEDTTPLDVIIDDENFLKTQVKRKVLGYVSKQD